MVTKNKRISKLRFLVGESYGRPFMTDLTAANTRSPRRIKFTLPFFLLLLSVFAFGCIRSSMVIVVEESAPGFPSAELKVRTLVSPAVEEALAGMFGDPVDFWSLSGDEDPSSLTFDPPLEGAYWIASDPDGWEGIAYNVRGPLEDVLAIAPVSAMENMASQAGGGLSQEEDDNPAGDNLTIEKTDNGWNFSWQVENTAEDGLTDQMEADLSEMGIDLDTSGFEFDLSVSLPGELVNTNSEDVSVSLDATTARWKIRDMNASLNFTLITETEDVSEGSAETEEDSGGLGIAWVLTIAFIGIALITLFFFRIDRKISV